MTYRIITIRDSRTPGFRWWEIEARASDGTTEIVAVCDTREEARETLRALKSTRPLDPQHKESES